MANGWSAKRRAQQAAAIHRWAPWKKATGPKSVSGKARSAQNGLRHGGRSQAVGRLAKALGRAVKVPSARRSKP